MKTIIAVPTFGPSINRLVPLINTIARFTKGFDYELLVRDDATPDLEQVVLSEHYVQKAGGTFLQGERWSQIWGNLDALGWEAVDRGAELICFLNDDCLLSKGWLYPIQYFYEWNEALKPGMVSGPILEAWELTMDGRMSSDLDFYSEDFNRWSDHGCVTREHIQFDEEKFNSFRDERRITTVGSYTPMGPIVDGRYRLERPVPLSGGVGPYFTIKADVFKEIGGFEKCEFIADFEAMIGFKVWDAGYKCCLIPAPPAYHARGVGTRMAIGGSIEDGIFSDKSEAYEPWTEKGKERFKEKWGFETVTDAIKHYEKKYQDDATRPLMEANYIKYQDNKFPINVEYDKLTDINLGSIHWRDEKQAKRMIWLAERCEGNILDVGCATGGLVNFLKGTEQHWLHYIGVDLDRVRVDEAKKEHGDETSFYVIDAVYGLPFADGAFNVSVCSDMLEHVPRRLGIQVVEELCRVTTERVLLTFPVSKEFMANLDHVWDSTVSEIQKFLEPVSGTHHIEIESTSDFAMVELTRKVK